jgi:mRNA interferase MazF
VGDPDRSRVERGQVVRVRDVPRLHQPSHDVPARDSLYVVVQNDKGNHASIYTIVVSLKTLKENAVLFDVNVTIAQGDGGLHRDSVADCAIVFTIPRENVVDKIGKLRDETMRRIDRALMISFGLDRDLPTPGTRTGTA